MSESRARPPFTPEATIGPFYPGVFVADMRQDLWDVSPLVAHHPQGRPITLAARFVDSRQRPVPSLVVELWQANARGRYRHPLDASATPLDPQFDGFARLRTGDDGVLRCRTVMPGSHPVPNQHFVRAPHLRLTIFASGIDRLVTQVFFDGEPLNASDPVLQSLEASLRDRLIARRAPHDADEYQLTIVMRGDGETPFFDDWES